MKQFKDGDGRDWQLDVNIQALKDVRQRDQVDLWGFFGDEASRIMSDPPLLVDVLYTICRVQCEQRQLSAADFGKLFKSDVLENAGKALVGAVIDFFPTSRQTILNATVAKSEKVAKDLAARALVAIEQLDATQLLKPTSSPGSSASTTPLA